MRDCSGTRAYYDVAEPHKLRGAIYFIVTVICKDRIRVVMEWKTAAIEPHLKLRRRIG